MRTLYPLLQKNKSWAEQIQVEHPDFFAKLVEGQQPNYFWIGCSDSRVPATEVLDLNPGDVFVHRNVANVVVHTDLNCLSALQYAVEQLQVEHVIVCGHYGCGGVQAALEEPQLGLIDNWLRHIRAVKQKHTRVLGDISDDEERFQRLCELNVIEQVVNVCQTTIVEQAWERGQELAVHGWIYALSDGLIKELTPGISSSGELREAYEGMIGASPAQ